VAREFNVRLEERIGDRTRIARDLHDTLLQGFQGVLLAQAISTFGEELVPHAPDVHPTDQGCPEFCVQVIGHREKLAPILRDEVYRIAVVAVRNAFQHANAQRIVVEIHSGKREFRLRGRDDGKGIDSKILEAGGRDGHLGLAGMDERARQGGGKVSIWSEIDTSTEVELAIPPAIAYAKPADSHRSTLSRKGA
jgi:signal transduction histidine kinase